MIPIIRTPEEAKNFFLRNSSGACRCIRKDGQEKTCECYDDCLVFFGAAR